MTALRRCPLADVEVCGGYVTCWAAVRDIQRSVLHSNVQQVAGLHTSPPLYSFACDRVLQGNITAGVSVSIDDASCVDSLPLGIAGHI